MPDNFREHVDAASSIKGILESYPGNSILRELLQNSDDAGATSQVFIFDMRTHGTKSLLDPVLKGTQGPALLAYNNSTFKDSDWRALSTIRGSNKMADETKTGKFGLGFRAVYHVTDNPHVMSGNKLVIFDPHDEFSRPIRGGAEIDVQREGSQYRDQLSAFEGVVPNPSGFLDGTVVRLPLRTDAQAALSRIKSTSTLVADMQQYLEDFIAKELGVALLFLQHVTSIELRKITPEGEDRFLAGVKITDPSIAVRRSATRRAGSTSAFVCPIAMCVGDIKTSRIWRICHSCGSPIQTAKVMSARLSYDVGERLKEDKLLSHIAFAIPLDKERLEGRLFTLLPLPIATGFPAHMHAIFALTPDRQGLRNEKEMGIGERSRERFLAAWNRVLFEEFAPKAWATMLQVLIADDRIDDPWTAWTPCLPATQAADVYWGNVLVRLLAHVIDADLPVFPAKLGSKCISRSSAVFAAWSEDAALVTALTRAGMPIVQTPDHIFQLLKDGKYSAKCDFFTRAVVHRELKRHSSELASCSDEEKRVVLDYLLAATPPCFDFVIGLPIIPLVNGTWIALRRSKPGRNAHVMLTAEEARLFGECENEMIALSSISPGARQTLVSSSTKQSLNVEVLGVAKAQKYLCAMFGHLDPGAHAVPLSNAPVTLNWLTCFWMWLNGRRDLISSEVAPSIKQRSLRYTHSIKGSKQCVGEDLISVIAHLHMIPTSTGFIRKIQCGALVSDNTDVQTMDVLKTIGITFLHSSIAHSTGASVLRDAGIAIPSHDLFYMLKNVDSQSFHLLDREASRLLQRFFVNILQSRPCKLDGSQKTCMKQFPVFSVRVSGDSPDPMATGDIGPAAGHLIYLKPDVADLCPLPQLQEATTFIELLPETRSLALCIDENATKDACNELDVLRLALPRLEKQPLKLLDALIARTIPRLMDLSENSRDLLRRSRFIPVLGRPGRLSPSELVDPQSEIASLFSEDDGKFPGGNFGTGQFLCTMQAQKFLRFQLDPDMISERITYISNSDDSQIATTMAERLLRLLHQTWRSDFHHCLAVDIAWLPTTGGVLRSRDKCRDKVTNVFLFDAVMSVATVDISHPNVRSALGWSDPVPFDVIQAQLSATLDMNMQRNERLLALINYMAERWDKGAMTDQNMNVLRGTVLDRSWIPWPSGRLLSTRYALLAPDMKIGPFFRSLPQSLSTGICGRFVRQMGCVDRPSLENLFVEFATLASSTFKVQDIIELLEEVSRHVEQDGAQLDKVHHAIFPDHCGHLRSYHDVYYDDMKRGRCFATDHGVPTHASLSESLATDLGLRFLSSLELDEDLDEDEDDLEIGEELVTRISSVLHDYDIKYAFNEILANASDAGALSVSILLDERSFPTDTILTAEMAQFQRSPSFILHNSGVFTRKDFDGLRAIGMGGKSENPDSIGRFGLGALSLYHFSEIVFVVSGGYIMIMDPSANYLPPLRGTLRRRNCILRPLSTFIKKYPDLLKPLDGLFGFSLSSGSYHGTMFRLPLRNLTQRTGLLATNHSLSVDDGIKLLKNSYYELARNALFFTGLEKVTARRRFASGTFSSLWSVHGKRQQQSQLGTEPTAQFMDLHLVDPSASTCSERWLITGFTTPLSSVPEECISVPQKLRITSSKTGLVVRLALLVPSDGVYRPNPPHYLFSGLRLPQETMLPVHVDAKFAVSTDRRSIRFDPPDGAHMRIPESAYNLWILSTLVPCLYMYTLHHLAHSPKRQVDSLQWWPRQAHDSISREVVRSFYAELPNSSYCFCPTATGTLVKPRDAVFPHLEPGHVRMALVMMKLPEYAQIPEPILAMMPMDRLRTASADYVGQSIGRPPVSTALCKLFNEGKLKVARIDSLLRYLLEGQASLLDLPLLVRADESVTDFQHHVNAGHTGIVYDYHRDNQRYCDIFPRSSFIHPDYSRKTVELLVAKQPGEKPAWNVRPFDAEAVVELLKSVEKIFVAKRCQHPEETLKWIKTFWSHYHTLPDPPSAEMLEGYPLLTTYHGDCVSMKLFHEGKVLADPGPREQWLISIMKSLNITVLREPPPMLNLPFTLVSFLTVIAPHVSTLATKLQASQLQQLGRWITKHSQLHFQGTSQATLRSTLLSLPIWPSREDGCQSLRSANDVRMLPEDVPIRIASKFLPHTCITEYSQELLGFWSQVVDCTPREHALSALDVSKHLVLGSSLNLHDLDDYIALIQTCLVRSNSRTLQVPDGNLKLVRVTQLFDESIPVFSAAFHSNEAASFVHPAMRGLQSALRPLGLQHRITYESFQQCADAVDADAQRLSGGNLPDRAEIAYECYERQLPSLIMRNSYKWASLDCLRFARRDAQRCRHATYNVQQYCSPLPDIVAPSQLVREKFERIAWTQRGLFRRQPAENLVAVNPSLGVPRPDEVVTHLRVLSLEIAPLHRGDQFLLRDVRETYKWLNDHSQEARDALLKRPDDALFLNEDSPSEDKWRWCSAKELVFNLHYDENNLLCVREFLQPFRSLLLAAGAHEVQDPRFDQSLSTLKTDDLRGKFDEMRKAGHLTDMILRPTEDVAVETDRLRVHSVFLAASIPHIKSALVSGWVETKWKEYPFHGSYFAACAVIEFVYTGVIPIPEPKDGDEASDLLNNLLELFEVADTWDMDGLKTNIERLIAQQFKLVNPVTYRTILKQAKRYNATELVTFCEEYREQNCALLKSLSQDDHDSME